MKPHYWNQAAPDADDETLRKMIAEGVVPMGCLWGGLLVEHTRKALDADPCAYCECPKRERCGGRPKIAMPEVAAAPAEHAPDNESGARKLQRAGFIRTLRSMMK